MKRIGIPAVALGAIALIALFARGRDPAPPRRNGSPLEERVLGFVENRSPTDSAPHRPLRLRLVKGETYSYDFRLRVKISELDMTLAGALDMVVTEAAENRFGIAFRSEGVRVAISSQDKDVPSWRAWTTVDSRSRILETRFPPGLDAHDRSTVRGLLHNIFFSFPEGSEREWSAVEEDATGRYEARYRLEDDRGVRITKNKLRYLSLISEAAEIPSLDGRAEGTFDLRTGMARSILLKERVEAHTFTAMTAEVELELVSRERRFDPSWAEGDGELENPEEEGKAMARESRLRLLEERIRSREVTLDVLLARLGAAAQPEERWEELQDAMALFAVDPEAVDGLRNRLRAGGVAGEVAATLLSALGASQSPEAQALLLEIAAEERWGCDLRAAAIHAMASCEKPLPEASAILQRASGDPEVGESALLILGAVASRTSEGEPTRFLLEQLVAAPDAQRKALVLEAIGNSGAESALDQVIPIAEKEADEEVRATAIRSMRRMAGDRAGSALTRAVTEDPAERVRAAAARTIAERDPTSAAPVLASVLERETSVEVRSAAFAFFASRAAYDASAKEIVERVSLNDASPALRDQAAEILRQAP